MSNKMFSQSEVNRIVAVRVNREHERLIHAFESHMTCCIDSIHQVLYPDMRTWQRNLASGMLSPLHMDGNLHTEPTKLPHVDPNDGE